MFSWVFSTSSSPVLLHISRDDDESPKTPALHARNTKRRSALIRLVKLSRAYINVNVRTAPLSAICVRARAAYVWRMTYHSIYTHTPQIYTHGARTRASARVCATHYRRIYTPTRSIVHLVVDFHRLARPRSRIFPRRRRLARARNRGIYIVHGKASRVEQVERNVSTHRPQPIYFCTSMKGPCNLCREYRRTIGSFDLWTRQQVHDCTGYRHPGPSVAESPGLVAFRTCYRVWGYERIWFFFM